MTDELFHDPISDIWREEGLFARDFDGQLIRLEKATDADYRKPIHMWIDDQFVVVPAAVPTTDSQGNIINDADGVTVPRRTTIYDAAVQLFEARITDFERELDAARLNSPDYEGTSRLLSLPTWKTTDAVSGLRNPIPTLCHQTHLTPVGVCRICAVETARPDTLGSEIVPACFHPVRPFMAVKTLRTSDRVRRYVRTLLGMLADRRTDPQDVSVRTDLEELCRELEPLTLPKPSRATDPQDYSSLLLQVDHSACILCERCMRSCGEVKHNHVIGRRGKSGTARITFDLDTSLLFSSCVDCGECMITCPTTALSFKKEVPTTWRDEQVAIELKKKTRPDSASNPIVTAEELKTMDLFRHVPLRFLQWNAGSVVRRHLTRGEILCDAGDYGSTAYMILNGELGIYLPKRQTTNATSGWLGRFIPSRRPQSLLTASDQPDFRRTKDDLIVGEMTCMNNYPRNATVKAETDCEVLELRRNILFMLQRDPVARRTLDGIYRARAIESFLPDKPTNDEGSSDRRRTIFSSLMDHPDGIRLRQRCREILHRHCELLRVGPGQLIFRQGEDIGDDSAADIEADGRLAGSLYIIRVGYVKFTQVYQGQEVVLDYLGPGHEFGEIALITCLANSLRFQHDAPASWQAFQALKTLLPKNLERHRTATARALDHVELIRIPYAQVRQLLMEVPPVVDESVRIATRFVEIGMLKRSQAEVPLKEFLEQGIFNGQKLLALDLEACTRCDECVKACADTHGGISRLIRDGLTFDKYLIASACRSCSDPYCLIGCPVDAIHREGRKGAGEIQIADYCIGCGQCAANCPYGNINMVEAKKENKYDESSGRTLDVKTYKATTCDLCRSLPGVAKRNAEVSCVYACPHEAAFRWTGEELLERVRRSQANK